MTFRIAFFASLAVCLTMACSSTSQTGDDSGAAAVVEAGPSAGLVLPEPFATESVRKRSVVVGWPEGHMPTALPGFEVTLFADDLDNPRQLYVLPNGDVLVAESIRERLVPGSVSKNRITLLRDADQDGSPEVRDTFVSNLNMPFGMQLVGDAFYVGNTDGLVRFPYQPGQRRITAKGEKILDLPAGGHYTRNLVANADGTRLFISVGSGSNVDEDGEDAKDPRRAAILEVNLDGSGMRVFASGLRNPVGLDLEPVTNALWTVVNERDRLGDQLVPDFLTSLRDGSFYGWPYSYFGQNEEPRKKGERPDLWLWPSRRTLRWGPTGRRWGWSFTKGRRFPSNTTAALLSGCTDRGTGPSLSATRWRSFPLKTGSPAARCRISSPASSRMKRPRKFTGGLWALP